jgi:hypothetical protein
MSTTTQKRPYGTSTKTLLLPTKRGMTNSGNFHDTGTTTTKCIISGNCLNILFLCTVTLALFFQIYGTSLTMMQSVVSSSSSITQQHQQQHHNQINTGVVPQQQRNLNVASTPCTNVNSNTQQQQQQQRQVSSENYDTNNHDNHEIVSLPAKYRIGATPHNGRLRVLVGIVSADFFNDQVYRKRHRELFKLWNDERVCSLPEFKSKPLQERYVCELIYTFVIGANPNTTPELVDHSRPFEVQRPITGTSRDLNEPDMTLLNIRENMNEGKSQTWMYYGAMIAEEYDIDYVAKCDADSMLHLHEFFHFAYKNMPPAPYNTMMYIGALRDKAYWPKHTTDKERVQYESYFGKVYDGVHLYVAGQLYIMATDLAKFVGQEALRNKCSYCEGHEDHDISTMAFHSPEPIKLVVIGRTHRFWEHPVKGEPRWKRIWAREQARMAGIEFEGRLFTTNSTIHDVLGSNVNIV